MDWHPPAAWERMESWLRGLVSQVGVKPKAVLVVSAHWEAEVFTVNAQATPGLLYDYYGFPEHTYQLTWPAPGAPALAAEIRARLSAADMASAEEHKRGWDHGVFIPMKLVFPNADVPTMQLSLRSGLNPAEHIAAGRALAPLRRQGVLIIGSGMSYHNMQQLRAASPAIDPDSRRFDTWLAETVALPRAQREQRLIDWAQAPGGRASHPVAEHLLPLHVVAGAAGEDPGQKVFQDQVLGSMQSAFLFGG
jgi:aromatic ring-opening dioxygenase catalytic subunit (LigB family)